MALTATAFKLQKLVTAEKRPGHHHERGSRRINMPVGVVHSLRRKNPWSTPFFFGFRLF
jgi:hypothetical protein